MRKFSGMILGAAPMLLLAQNVYANTNASNTITVNVSGLRNTNGALIACLWIGDAGFPTCQKSTTALKQTSKISGGEMRVQFKGVTAGSYAVSVQHDEDGNGKLKTNFIGMPKEGVGISNNKGGIPRYSRSIFEVKTDTIIAINMRYL